MSLGVLVLKCRSFGNGKGGGWLLKGLGSMVEGFICVTFGQAAPFHWHHATEQRVLIYPEATLEPTHAALGTG